MWDISALAVKGTALLKVDATVESGATNTRLTPSAYFDSSTPTDPNGSNDYAEVNLAVSAADLSLSLTPSTYSYNPGDTLDYQVDIKNSGPNNASGVAANVLLPSDITVNSFDASVGSYDSVSGNWTGISVNNGDTAHLTLHVTVSASTTETELDTVAQITTSSAIDPDSTPNNGVTFEDDYAEAVIYPTPTDAELALDLSTSDDTPQERDLITLTIDLHNYGPEIATGVNISVILPPELTYVSHTASIGIYHADSGLWTISSAVVDYNAGQLQIKARVVPGTGGHNFAVIVSLTASDQPNPFPNNASQTLYLTVTQAGGVSDLCVNITSFSINTPNEGDGVDYQIHVTNNGPDAATNIQIANVLPTGFEDASLSPFGASSIGSDGHTWMVPSLAAGAGAELDVYATIAPGTVGEILTATEEVTASDQSDPDSTPNNHNPAEDDQASVVFTVQDRPLFIDVSLTAGIDPFSAPTPNPGETTDIDVTISNAGPQTATDCQVSYLLPPSLILISANGADYDAGTGIWSVGVVQPGNQHQLTLTVAPAKETEGQTISTTAEVFACDQIDLDSTPNNHNPAEDDQASFAFTVGSVAASNADLGLDLNFGSDITANPGDTISLTYEVLNNGGDNATNIAINAPLPSGLTFSSASASSGSYDPATKKWTIGTLLANDETFLTIDATVTGALGSTITADTSIAAEDQTDSNSSNNTASVNIFVGADAQLQKSVSPTTANEGDLVVYTATVSNGGPGVLINADVSNLLPSGVTFVQVLTGSYDPTTNTGSVFSISSGSSETIQVQAAVNSGTAGTTLDSASALSNVQPQDPNLGNNSDNAPLVVQNAASSADLQVTIAAQDQGPNPSSSETFTIEVNNLGSDNATGIKVHVGLPPQVLFSGTSLSQGSYDPQTSLWTIPQIGTGGSAEFILYTNINSTASVGSAADVTASIAQADQSDPDTSNNTATASLTIGTANLGLQLHVDNAAPAEGDLLDFTLTISNARPGNVDDAVINFPLPSELTFADGSNSDPATGTLESGSLSSGSSDVEHVYATVNGSTSGSTINASAQIEQLPRTPILGCRLT